MTETIIGATFNVYKHLTDLEKQDDLTDLFDRYPNLSVAGLQEINWNLISADVDYWEFHQPEGYAKKDPVIWNPTVWGAIAKGHNVLCERVVTSDNKVLPERNAVWVVLEGPLGRLGFVNCHLHHDVEARPGVPNGTMQQQDHFSSLLKLRTVANSIYKLYECPVIITGDFNVDYGSDKEAYHWEFPYQQMTSAGYRCVWELGEQSTRTNNPTGGRTIDHAWGRGVRFTRVRTPDRWSENDPVESDHLPVIFDFQIG